ncbi:MAG TPA: hypothetical protein VMF03_13940 [Steroidobacteraceae bacterium]|nr:hypothetical protein [Steroidobacteraceae bacterium]
MSCEKVSGDQYQIRLRRIHERNDATEPDCIHGSIADVDIG